MAEGTPRAGREPEEHTQSRAATAQEGDFTSPVRGHLSWSPCLVTVDIKTVGCDLFVEVTELNTRDVPTSRRNRAGGWRGSKDRKEVASAVSGVRSSRPTFSPSSSAATPAGGSEGLGTVRNASVWMKADCPQTARRPLCSGGKSPKLKNFPTTFTPTWTQKCDFKGRINVAKARRLATFT